MIAIDAEDIMYDFLLKEEVLQNISVDTDIKILANLLCKNLKLYHIAVDVAEYNKMMEKLFPHFTCGWESFLIIFYTIYDELYG